MIIYVYYFLVFFFSFFFFTNFSSAFRLRRRRGRRSGRRIFACRIYIIPISVVRPWDTACQYITIYCGHRRLQPRRKSYTVGIERYELTNTNKKIYIDNTR